MTWTHAPLTMDNKLLRFISWNVNGLNSRGHEVHYYVTKHDVDVILLQETRDRVGDALTLKGYKKYQLLANDVIRGLDTQYRPNQLKSHIGSLVLNLFP